MSATLIDGKSVAAAVEEEVRVEVEALSARGIRPGLVAIRVGEDPASEIYVRSKAKKAQELGLFGQERHLAATISEDDLLAEVIRCNEDDSIDGILVQLPLPKHINTTRLLDAIDPMKDVDGFHPVNVGKLHLNRKALVPCTPAGCIRLIESTGEKIEGKHAVVVGRSDIVGKPVAALLLQRNATVTICHSRTPDLGAVIREADIVVAAVGKPLMVKGDMVKPGAIVIDVGINRIEAGHPAYELLDEAKKRVVASKGSTVVGDVDFPKVKEVASWITPVPGGVGPMTIVMLMKNTVDAAKVRRR